MKKSIILLAIVLVTACGSPSAPVTVDPIVEPGPDSSVILPALIKDSTDSVKLPVDSLVEQ